MSRMIGLGIRFLSSLLSVIHKAVSQGLECCRGGRPKPHPERTMLIDSGTWLKKSMMRQASWMWLLGFGFSACTMSGNFIPSRMKNLQPRQAEGMILQSSPQLTSPRPRSIDSFTYLAGDTKALPRNISSKPLAVLVGS